MNRSSLHCSKCGKEHITNSRYCKYCKSDLEPSIIEFKNKRLPIHFDGGIFDDDPYDEEEVEVDRLSTCFFGRQRLCYREAGLCDLLQIPFALCRKK
ncbi:MAG: hypothetical protein KGD64_11405 [Candidatus Heimdallarchaeota archaeon]|nr:hypothetical protein [Candidatus Heimdallarchaeota archaeon]